MPGNVPKRLKKAIPFRNRSRASLPTDSRNRRLKLLQSLIERLDHSARSGTVLSTLWQLLSKAEARHPSIALVENVETEPLRDETNYHQVIGALAVDISNHAVRLSFELQSCPELPAVERCLRNPDRGIQFIDY